MGAKFPIVGEGMGMGVPKFKIWGVYLSRRFCKDSVSLTISSWTSTDKRAVLLALLLLLRACNVSDKLTG